MTLTEMQAMQEQFPTAWAVLVDRLWEVERNLLIEMLFAHMDKDECERALRMVHDEVEQSRQQEMQDGYTH